MINFSKILKSAALAVPIYGLSCIFISGISHLSEKKLSVPEAREIVSEQQDRFFFRDKKINFIPLENNGLERPINGMMYSANGEYYVVMNEDNLTEGTLLHELWHIALREPNNEERNLEETVSSMNNYVGEMSIGDYFKYLMSPEELACNLYSIVGRF